MILEGLDVVRYLNGQETVRDGTLVSFSVQRIDTNPVVELVFKNREDRTARFVTLELRDIQEFQYDYTKENSPADIGFLKCLMTDSGDFYLSLDPYDERETFVSEKDNEYFRSKLVKLTTYPQRPKQVTLE